MDERIYVSSGAFRARDLSEVLEQCARYGITGLELSSNLQVASSELSSIVRQCSGVDRLLVHNYFPPPADPFTLNLASGDEAIRRRSIDLARTAIDLCERLDAPFYSVHAGFVVDIPPSLLGRPEAQAALAVERRGDRSAALNRFSATVAELAAYARSRGVGLLVENNVVVPDVLAAGGRPPLLLVDPVEIKRFFEDRPSSNVGLLLDLGHLRVAGRVLSFDPREALDNLLPVVGALHLSWNDGTRDTNAPIPEGAWILEPLSEAADFPIVLEAYDLSETEIESQIALLERALDSTSAAAT